MQTIERTLSLLTILVEEGGQIIVVLYLIVGYVRKCKGCFFILTVLTVTSPTERFGGEFSG